MAMGIGNEFGKRGRDSSLGGDEWIINRQASLAVQMNSVYAPNTTFKAHIRSRCLECGDDPGRIAHHVNDPTCDYGMRKQPGRVFDPALAHGSKYSWEEQGEKLTLVPSFKSAMNMRTLCLHSTLCCNQCGAKAMVGHYGSMVISIAASCVRNRFTGTRAGLCIFAGRADMIFIPISKETVTNQSAELLAAIFALEKALAMQLAAGIKQVVIKCHSQYCIYGMTRWINTWKLSGWTRTNGKPLANAKLWQRLEALITYLESQDVDVRFWLVSRENNEYARKVANYARSEPDWQVMKAKEAHSRYACRYWYSRDKRLDPAFQRDAYISLEEDFRVLVHQPWTEAERLLDGIF